MTNDAEKVQLSFNWGFQVPNRIMHILFINTATLFENIKKQYYVSQE